MRRLGALFFVLAASLVAIGQAQTAPSPTRPAVVTNYNAFTVPLGVPTAGPIIAVPTTGTPVCVAAMNLPFSNTYFTPQGSDDTYVWKPLTGIGGGSIITPGVYVGPDPYRFFRLYFTQSSFPGASGYEACADNSTSLLAPMLNGIDGVLNTYQQLTAIGHPGCAVFDANGFLLPQGGGLPCAGGGGSFVCDAPHSCVTFQTSPSPSPESTDAGGNSAAVAGILQGGTVYSQFGRFQTTGNFLIPCPAEDCAHWQWQSLVGKTDIATTFTGPFSEVEPSSQNTVPGFCFGWGCPNANVLSANQFGVNLGAGVGDEEIYLNLEHRPDGAGRANVVIGSFGSTGSGSVNLQAANITLRDNEPGGVTPSHVSLVGDLFVRSGGLWDDGPNPESGTYAWSGHCAMSSSTSCSITTQANYASSFTAGYCIAQSQGTTPIAASCSWSSTTATVTAASANSLTWAIMTFGAASP